TVDNVTGLVNFAAGILGVTVTGNITVATVNFLAKVATASTNITFHFAPPPQRETDVFSAGNSVLGTATGANVTVPVLVSIAVTPTSPSIAAGLTQQFTAIGTYSDLTTANLTASANWTSSNTTVAVINSAGLATSVAQGTTVITATWGSVSGSASLTVTAPIMIYGITVTPSFASIPLGLTQQFTATGTYDNGSTANLTHMVAWSSSSPGVATITSAGLASSVTQGAATITATLIGLTGSATLTVTAPNLISLTVSPATATVTAGSTANFTSTGNFTNGLADITVTATWTSSDPSIASIETAGQGHPGVARSYRPGTVTITATQSGKSATATLAVTPATIQSVAVAPVNPVMTLGSTRQFRAIAIKSDGSLVDVTTTATWTSSNTSVATVGATGLATAVAAGVAVITANVSGVIGTTAITVIASPLVSIAVTPATPAVAAGWTQQFAATGNYSGFLVDLTSSVTWSNSNNVVARIRAGGLATSYATGTTTITATFGTISGTATLTVGAAVLDSVKITPVNPVITFVSGAPPTLQFKATAVSSDGSVTDNTAAATWTSSAPGVAAIGTSGLATTTSPGITTISATVGGKVGTTLFTVLPDTVAPVVRLTSPAEGLVTSNSTLAVFGNVDDVNAVMTVIVNGGAPIAPAMDGGGNFGTFVNWAAGINTILVRAVDTAGNIGTSGTRTVRIDPRKPNITIFSPAEGFVTSNPVVTVTGRVVNADAGSITLRVNGIVVATGLSSGDFSVLVILFPGRNSIIASGYGTGGNGNEAYRGTSGARTVTLDTIAPVVAIISPASGSIFNTPGITVTGTVDDPAITAATLTLNGVSQSVPVRNGRFSQDVKLATGSNAITAQATDMVGNIPLPASVTATFDNTKPQVTITAPTNRRMTNAGGLLVTGRVSDQSITMASLFVNGVAQTIAVAPDGSFSQMVALTAGPNTVEVRATDASANTGTSGIINVNLDNKPPGVIIGL
ncbi:MAG: Ig-like domain-containing protein, partial [Chloroflexota bacterium]